MIHDHFDQVNAILDANAVLLATAQSLGWKVPLAAAGLIVIRLLMGGSRGL